MRGIWFLVGALVGCGEVKARPDGGADAPEVIADAPEVIADAPKPKQHLYVANDATPGAIARYTLPLVAGAAPDFTIPTEAMFDVAFDAAGNLIGSSNTGKLVVFIQPLSGTSIPAATFQNGAAAGGAQAVVTPSGNLIAATQSNLLNVFAPPFTNNSVPVSMITASVLSSTAGAALDAQANLFVANNVPGGSGNLLVFPPPYQVASVITQPVTGTGYRNIVVSGTQLYVASVNNAARVDVYNLPLTNASVPTFSIVTGTNIPEAIAMDNEGHIYVGNLGDKTVVRYSPPFSASSAPDVTVTAPGFTIFGIGIGP